MFLRAYVFIGTNAVRALSVIALVLVFVSNILVMVQDIKSVHRGDTASFTLTDESGNAETFECDYFEGSTVPNQPAGAFWAVLNRLFIIFTSVVLLLSEIGWPDLFFRNFLPVLGPDFGVGILGALQWITSASILSHHVQPFPLVSAWFLFAIGCLNIVLGLVFRSSVKVDRSFTTFREARAKELLPGPIQEVPHPPSLKTLDTSIGSIFSRDEKSGDAGVSRNNTGATFRSQSSTITGSHLPAEGFGSGYGFGRQGEKAANLKGFMISRPVESLPRYAPRPPKAEYPPPPVSDDEGSEQGIRFDAVRTTRI